MLGNKNISRLNVFLFLIFLLFLNEVYAVNLTALPSCTFSNADSPCTGMNVDTYCINGNQIYKSEPAISNRRDTGSCITIDFDSDGYIVFECSDTSCNDPDNYTGNLLVYGYVQETQTLTQNPLTYFYIGNNVSGKLLHCQSGNNNACTVVKNKGNYLNLGDSKDSYPLITCTGPDGSAICVANDVSEGIFIDSDSAVLDDPTKHTKLIYCEGKVCESEAVSDSSIFLNYGSRLSNGKFENLIKCVEDSSDNGSNGGNGVYSCSIINNGSTSTLVTHYITDLDFDKESDRLITCTPEGCIVEGIDVIGYFINSDPDDDKIIMCNTDETGNYDCIVVEDNTDSCSEVGDVLITGEGDEREAYLCLSTSADIEDHIKIESDLNVEDQYKFITLDEEEPEFPSNPGKICVKISGDGSVMKVESNLCLTGEVVKECEVSTGTNCIENTYYLVHSITGKPISSGGGYLYYCNTENSPCTQIKETGFYAVNQNEIYSCYKMACQKATPVSECDSDNIGRIVISSDNKLSICLNDEVSVELNKSSNGDYVVLGSIGNIFTTDPSKYAIVNIKEQVVTLNENYNNNLKYVYANKGKGNQKIMENSTSCPKEGNNLDKASISELLCNNGICTEV